MQVLTGSRRMLRRYATRFYPVALLLLGFALFGWLVTLAPTYQFCIAKEYQPYSYGKSYDLQYRTGAFFICEAETLNANTGALTALATIAIAVFTLTLWVVTGESVRLARDEFSASHRPKLLLRDASAWPARKLDSGERIEVTYTIVNVGDTPCRIIQSATNLEFTQGGVALLLVSLHRNVVTQIRLEAGESSPETHKDETLSWNINTFGYYPNNPDVGLWFSGHIVYVDDRKVMREMAFRRRYNPGIRRFEYAKGTPPGLDFSD